MKIRKLSSNIIDNKAYSLSGKEGLYARINQMYTMS